MSVDSSCVSSSGGLLSCLFTAVVSAVQEAFCQVCSQQLCQQFRTSTVMSVESSCVSNTGGSLSCLLTTVVSEIQQAHCHVC